MGRDASDDDADDLAEKMGKLNLNENKANSKLDINLSEKTEEFLEVFLGFLGCVSS